MDAEQLVEMVEAHCAWLAGTGGRQAVLRGAVLRGSVLRGLDLRRADLREVDLREADLRRADLRRADLREADLRGGNLRGADLRMANLHQADLREADLRDVMFSGAVGLCPLTAASLEILPRGGEVRGWKRCRDGVLVELVVPDGVERSNASGRKCRARLVRVIAVHGAEVGVSLFDVRITYRAGTDVRCHRWDSDRWNECGGGIHFYLTREECEAHIV